MSLSIRQALPDGIAAQARGGGQSLGRRLRMALVAVALALAVLGLLGAWGVGALRANVDAWSAITTLDGSSETLSAATERAAAGGLAPHRAAMTAAFDAVYAALVDFAVHIDVDPQARLEAPLRRARAAFENAVAYEEEFMAPKAALAQSTSTLNALIAAEFNASWVKTGLSRQASMALEARQRDLYALQVAHGRDLDAALGLQEAVALFDRTYRAAGMMVPIDLSRIARCDGGACGPSTQRMIAMVQRLNAGLDGLTSDAAIFRAVRDAQWAVSGYVRTLRNALRTVTAQALATVDAVAAERARVEAQETRRRGLQRMTRLTSDGLRGVAALVAAPTLTELEAIAGRGDGIMSQFRARGTSLMAASDNPKAADAFATLVAQVKADWDAVALAKRRQLAGVMLMRDALAQLDGAIRAKTQRALSDARRWIALFATYTAGVLILAGAGAAALLIMAERRVAQPLAAVIDDVLRLAGGDVDRPVRTVAGPFAPLFRALETLREASSDRLRLERAQAQAALRLEKERADAAQLEAALQEEHGKIRFWRQVISMVNHELRTPLTVIDGQARRIHKALKHEDPAGLGERARLIRRSVQRTIELMETFLLNARAEAGQLDFAPAPFAVGALLAEVCETQMTATPTHRVLLDVAQAPARFDGDLRLLRHALANLLSNAVKYSPGADSVSVSCATRDGAMQIAVTDHGVGVPASEIDRLGGQFFRASTCGQVAGTGVGLHLTRMIAEAHQGRLEIVSSVGEGSTFTLSLPLVRENALTADAAEEAAAAGAAAARLAS